MPSKLERIRMPDALLEATRAECASLGITVAEGVRAALSAWTGCTDTAPGQPGRPRKIVEAQSDAA